MAATADHTPMVQTHDVVCGMERCALYRLAILQLFSSRLSLAQKKTSTLCRIELSANRALRDLLRSRNECARERKP